MSEFDFKNVLSPNGTQLLNSNMNILHTLTEHTHIHTHTQARTCTDGHTHTEKEQACGTVWECVWVEKQRFWHERLFSRFVCFISKAVLFLHDNYTHTHTHTVVLRD